MPRLLERSDTEPQPCGGSKSWQRSRRKQKWANFPTALFSLLSRMVTMLGALPNVHGADWILVFCYLYRVDLGLGLLGNVLNRGFHPGTVIFNSLIEGFCRAARVRDALELFERMPEMGCAPDLNENGPSHDLPAENSTGTRRKERRYRDKGFPRSIFGLR